MKISFTGGVRVQAELNGYRITTDQPVASGGDGSAPSPFDLFLASIGTCAGFYALRFCQERQIDTNGMELTLTTAHEGKRVAEIRVEIDLPAGFPEKYREALLRAVDQCAVKRHILEPPKFQIVTIPAREPAALIAS
jgi:putative redox protein